MGLFNGEKYRTGNINTRGGRFLSRLKGSGGEWFPFQGH
jgi:hypothetical protein